MRFHSSHTRTVNARDAALRKLSRINRFLIAGSVTLTAVLADVAANAFPGKTLHPHPQAKVKGTTARHHSKSPSSGAGSTSTNSQLRPPSQAPEAALEPKTESGSGEESAPASEPAPAEETTPTPARESAPAPEPTPEPAPVEEPAPAQESAPVVSGGS